MNLFKGFNRVPHYFSYIIKSTNSTNNTKINVAQRIPIGRADPYVCYPPGALIKNILTILVAGHGGAAPYNVLLRVAGFIHSNFSLIQGPTPIILSQLKEQAPQSLVTR